MKSLLTRLTESIGDNIARTMNKNEFIDENSRMEAYHITGNTGGVTLTDLSGRQLAKILDKENPALLKEIQKHLATSKECKKLNPKEAPRKRETTSSSSPSSSSNGSCGRSSGYSDNSCGSSSRNYGGSCGSSRPSSRC